MSEHTSVGRRSGRAAAVPARDGKAAGMIVSAFMIALGVPFLIRPGVIAGAAMYFAAAGFLLYGAYQMVAYARARSGLKYGWTLANGLVFTLLGLLLLPDGPLDPASYTFVFLLAFLSVMAGIMRLSACGSLRSAGLRGAGWMLASGVIDLLLGAFFIALPFFTVAWELAFILSAFLIAEGAAFFAESASGHHGRKI